MARRANQPVLTREQIVATALRLVDEHGLEGHSMRQLGAALGVDPTSVYHYIASKSELFDLLMDEVVKEAAPTAFDPSLPISDLLLAAARELRRALLRHPRLAPLFLVRSFRTLTQLAPLESLATALKAAGFSPAEMMTTINVVGTHAIALANAEAVHLVGADTVDHRLPTEEAVAAFPHVREIFADPTNYLGFEAQFEVSIHALVEGLLARQREGMLVPPRTPA